MRKPTLRLVISKILWCESLMRLLHQTPIVGDGTHISMMPVWCVCPHHWLWFSGVILWKVVQKCVQAQIICLLITIDSTLTYGWPCTIAIHFWWWPLYSFSWLFAQDVCPIWWLGEWWFFVGWSYCYNPCDSVWMSIAILKHCSLLVDITRI